MNVGLCISFYDFVEIGDPYIYPSEGSAHQIVRCRLVVLRPFIGEILTGRVIDSNKDGIRLSIEFFDDIYIPKSLLNQPSNFDHIKGIWVWTYDAENETLFPLELGEKVSASFDYSKITVYRSCLRS